ISLGRLRNSLLQTNIRKPLESKEQSGPLIWSRLDQLLFHTVSRSSPSAAASIAEVSEANVTTEREPRIEGFVCWSPPISERPLRAVLPKAGGRRRDRCRRVRCSCSGARACARRRVLRIRPPPHRTPRPVGARC